MVGPDRIHPGDSRPHLDMDTRSTGISQVNVSRAGPGRLLREAIVYAGQTIILALTYFGLGWIGLSIAEPPGYAAPIWLPAGVSLLGVLARGGAALPGVWLGSFLVHCWINVDR